MYASPTADDYTDCSRPFILVKNYTCNINIQHQYDLGYAVRIHTQKRAFVENKAQTKWNKCNEIKNPFNIITITCKNIY